MKWNLAALALGLSTLIAAQALADDDRPPTAEERTKIEEVLKAEGFTAWKGNRVRRQSLGSRRCDPQRR